MWLRAPTPAEGGSRAWYNNLHIKATCPLRHGLTNTTHAKDTKRLTGDPHAEKVALADTISPSLAHDPIILKKHDERRQAAS